MEVHRSLNKELVSYLDIFRDWSFEKSNWLQLEKHSLAEKNRRSLNLGGDVATSSVYLKDLDHPNHVGYPIELYGLDLNYEVVRKSGSTWDPDFFNRIREINYKTDESLQSYLGAKMSALKAYYPAGGYISWHTNWNAPGYNIVFTYSQGGKGYWRHIDPSGSSCLQPDLGKLVHIDDSPGWHCKAGYFGSKENPQNVVWHSAYTDEPRLSLAYILHDKSIWENLVSEIGEA